ncbi:uncharacterized protein J3R85_016399 [Psidium guajava]|nr:uncharacterized protein J3R85_016399 [Psidium guajava]
MKRLNFLERVKNFGRRGNRGRVEPSTARVRARPNPLLYHSYSFIFGRIPPFLFPLQAHKFMMDVQSLGVPKPLVQAALQLGSEKYAFAAAANGGALSEQLVSMKEESMRIFKEYITKHNVPTDVPDDLVESSSDDDVEATEKPPANSKKTKLN